MVKRHPITDLDRARVDVIPDLGDDPARFVSGDHRLTTILQSQRLERRPGGRSVQFQVAAAHARCLDLEHDVPRPRGGVGKFDQFQCAVAGKYYTAHV